MKNNDLSDAIGNINLKYVEEARNYTAKRLSLTKIVSLAACIAILVTAIPAALILNREDASEDDDVHQETHNHEENIEDVLKGYGNLALSNGSLNLDVIQLSNGKIDKDTDSTIYDKYVYEYTPVDAKTVFDDMIAKALPYYGLTELENDMGLPHAYIKNTRYSVTSYEDIVTRRIYASGHTNGSRRFVNAYVDEFGYEKGTIKFPEEETPKKIFETFKDQIDLYNKIFVNNIDSCLILPAEYPSQNERLVYFWESSRQSTNTDGKYLLKKYEGKKYEDWAYNDLKLLDRISMLCVQFTLSDGYVEDISIADDFYTFLEIDNNFLGQEVMDHLALEIDKTYTCGSANEDFFNCASDLEQYLIDVLSMPGFSGSYTVDIRDPDDVSSIPKNAFGIKKHATLKMAIKPTEAHENDVVEFKFYSLDTETYFLYEIKSEYCVAGDNYIELITPERAIDLLISGYGIGDIGQNCYICREKYRPEILEYIQNNTTYELIMIPNVVFETENGELLYDLPFYQFITKPDENGKSYISYVVAFNYGYNIRFDLSEVNKTIYEHNLSLCPNAKDHRKIEREKKMRIEALKDQFVEEYLKANPDAFKSTAMKIASEKYKW